MLVHRSAVRAHSSLSRVNAAAHLRGPRAILDSPTAPYAIWALRLVLGVHFLQHVMRIVFGYEPADTTQLFGLPPGVSAVGVAWDALLGAALLYGVWARPVAVAAAVTLSVAMIQRYAGAAVSPFGWQQPILWIVALLALALAGDGAFALLPSTALFRARPVSGSSRALAVSHQKPWAGLLPPTANFKR